MKNLIFVIIILFSNNIIKAQMISSIDYVKIEEDSSYIIYNLKIKLDSSTSKEERLNLLKIELENNYKISSNKIIHIEEYIDKKHLTFRYNVKMKK